MAAVLAVPGGGHLLLRGPARVPHQPNLTPQWVQRQIRRGWRLLPITLGPQAYCNPASRATARPEDNPTREPTAATPAPASRARAGRRGRARRQGAGHPGGEHAVVRPRGLRRHQHPLPRLLAGVPDGWTNTLHDWATSPGSTPAPARGSATSTSAAQPTATASTCRTASGSPAGTATANTSTTYIADDGWSHGNRVKQYRGGHDETWGGVTDQHRPQLPRPGQRLGRRGRAACGGVRNGFRSTTRLCARHGSAEPRMVRAAQCLLTERGVYPPRSRHLRRALTAAAARAWRERRSMHRPDRSAPGSGLACSGPCGAAPVSSSSRRSAVRALQHDAEGGGAAYRDVTGVVRHGDRRGRAGVPARVGHGR